MKLVTFLLLFVSTCVFAQQNEFSFSGNYGTNLFNKPTYIAGLHYELALNEKVSLNYSAKIAFDKENGYTFQSPMGAFGGSMLFVMGLGEDEDFYTLGVLAWLVPEGVTYNHIVDENTIISPYLNPLALQYSSTSIIPYIEGGVKLKHYLSNSTFIGLNFGLSSTYSQASFVNYIGGVLGLVVD